MAIFPPILALLLLTFSACDAGYEFDGDEGSRADVLIDMSGLSLPCGENKCTEGLTCHYILNVCVLECDGLCPGRDTFCVEDPTTRPYDSFYSTPAPKEGICVFKQSNQSCEDVFSSVDYECCSAGEDYEETDSGVSCGVSDTIGYTVKVLPEYLERFTTSLDLLERAQVCLPTELPNDCNSTINY